MFIFTFIAALLCLSMVSYDGHAAQAVDGDLPKLVREQEHASQVVFARPRSSGGMIVSVDYSGGIFLWDPHSLRQVSTGRRAPFPVKTAALLDADTLLVFGSMPRALIAAIDLRGEQVQVIGQLGGEIASVSAALTNKTVRVAIADPHSIRVLEVGAKGVSRSVYTHDIASASAIAISDDGKFLAVASTGRRLTLRDAGTGRTVWSRQTDQAVSSLSVHTAAGVVLASYDTAFGSSLKRIDQLSLQSGISKRTLPLDPCSVFQVDILDSTRGLAICGPILMDVDKNRIPHAVVTWSLHGREAPTLTPFPQPRGGPLPFRAGTGWDASTQTLFAGYSGGLLAALKFGKNGQVVSAERLAAAPEITQTLSVGGATRQIASIEEAFVEPNSSRQRNTRAQIVRATIRAGVPAGTFSDEELENAIGDNPDFTGWVRNRMTLWDADAASGAVRIDSGLDLIVDVTAAGTGAARDVTMVEALSLASSVTLGSTVLALTRLAAGDSLHPTERRLLSIDSSTGLLREGIRRAAPDITKGICVTAQDPGMVRLSRDATVLLVACLAPKQDAADPYGFMAPDYDLLTYQFGAVHRFHPARLRVRGKPSRIELSSDGKLAAVLTHSQFFRQSPNGAEIESAYALNIVDVEQGKLVKTFSGLPQPAIGLPLAVSARSSQVFVALGRRTYRYSPRRQTLDPVNFQARGEDSGHITAIALDETDTLLAISRIGDTTEVYRLADRSELARVAHPGETLSQVYFDPAMQGRLVGASMSGGLALLDYERGEKVSNFFSSESGAWIAMAPEGTFSGTVGAETGLTVTDGRHAVSVDQLYDVFFRPDLLQRRLRGEHGAVPSPETIRRALAAPPPTVETRLDAGAKDRARLRISLRDAGGGIGGLRVFHNGKLARDMRLQDLHAAASHGAPHPRPKGERAAANPPFELSLEVPVGAGTNDYAVAALNGERSIQSRFSKITLERPALAPQARKAYVVAIGSNQFSDPAFETLKLAERSANGLGATLVDLMSRLVGRDQVSYLDLVGTESRFDKVQRALEHLARNARPDDIIAIVLVTHGKVLSSGELRVILSDTRPDGNNSLSGSQLVAAITAIPALTQLLVLDVCHAGAISDKVAENYQQRFAVFAGSAGIHVLTSTSAEEPALAEYDGMTVYTHFLNAGLIATDGARREGRSLKTIAALVQQNVSDEIDRFDLKQIPLTYSFGRDLLLP